MHKTAETEHVRRPVQLAHEEVTVERRPITERIDVDREGDARRTPR